ncbi:MAG: hypothetical protein WBC07_10305 [Methylotenera sp.]
MHSFLSRRKVLVASIFLVVVISGELFCRQILGLGNPPLYVADSKIEYMMKTDQDVRRFGNHLLVNHWGMRSPDFPKHKKNPDEIRILIVGDSVVNGGNETDQELLATSLLQHRLQESFGRPVIVGNVSAGSWGPGNWLAYVQHYGFFDADLLVLVVNSGDFADNPTFEPLDSNHPTQTPILALQEAIFRYLPGYLPSFSKSTSGQVVSVSPVAAAQGMSDLRQFLKLSQADEGRKVLMFHHPYRTEFLDNKFSAGHDEMRALAMELGVSFTELFPAYSKVGVSMYRDDIHPNVQGQKIISEELYEVILPNLKSLRSTLSEASQ